MIQSPGGVGKEKDGARMPRPARRGDHIWGKLAHGALDETRRTGLLPVGPLWLRASCFVSPSREWGRPDNRATCTATCCKSPTDRSRSKITIKTNQQATAQRCTNTGTGTGHRIPNRAAASSRLTYTRRLAACQQEYSSSVPPPCAVDRQDWRLLFVPTLPSRRMVSTLRSQRQSCVSVSGRNRGHGSRATRELKDPTFFLWGPPVPGQVGLVGWLAAKCRERESC